MQAPVAVRLAHTESNAGPREEPIYDFDSVYAKHFDFVWRNLRRLGVPEAQLRDASQEVFLVVYRKLGDFVPNGTLRSWLYSILRRVALAQRRQSRSRFTQDSVDADELTGNLADPRQVDPEACAARGQSLRLLLELLSTLDDDKRDALVIVDIEGMSVPEACMALDVNANTLYSRLRAARLQMRERLAKSNCDDWRQP